MQRCKRSEIADCTRRGGCNWHVAERLLVGDRDRADIVPEAGAACTYGKATICNAERLGSWATTS